MSGGGGPFLSIVIPTRNRAGLLRHALATVLSQTEGDYEVVVSDNASVDDTEAVVGAAGDPRVRYVRSDASLAQPDNWELGVAHATGEWVTVLGDDDGFVPSFAARLAGVVAPGGTEPVMWNEVWYYDPVFPPAWLRDGEANRMAVYPHSGKVSRVESVGTLAAVFRMASVTVPGMFNAAVHRSTLDRVRARRGRVFGAPDPYVTSGVAVLLEEPEYRWIEMPLTVRGLADATLSLNFVHNTRDAHESVREFDTADLFGLAPLAERTLATLVAESLLRMKKALPDDLAPYDLDVARYFVTVRRELDDPRRHPDGGAALDEWRRVLAAQPPAVRAAVRAELRRGRTGDGARRLARRVPGARALRNALRRDAEPGSRFSMIDGAEHDFADLPGAARHLDEHVLPALVAA